MKSFIVRLRTYSLDGSLENERYFGRSIRLIGGGKSLSPLVLSISAARKYATRKGAIISIKSSCVDVVKVDEKSFCVSYNNGNVFEKYDILEIGASNDAKNSN